MQSAPSSVIQRRWSSSRGQESPTRRRQRLNACSSAGASRSCHYAVLGLEPGASAAAVRAAWRRMAKALHPDVNADAGASAAFVAAKAAYDVLSDPVTRATYDAQQGQQWRPNAGAAVEDDGHDDRSSDVDTAAWFAAAAHWRSAASGSWQTSWGAASGRRRARAAAAAAAAADAAHRGEQDASPEDVLQQLDPQARRVVTHVFGRRLQRLRSVQELTLLLHELEGLRALGIDPDITMFDSGACNTPSASVAEAARAATTAGRGRRRHRRQRGRQRLAHDLPRFDELTVGELLSFMSGVECDAATALAARDWAVRAAAGDVRGVDVRTMADLQALLLLDDIMGAWDDGGVQGSSSYEDDSSDEDDGAPFFEDFSSVNGKHRK